MIVQLSKFLCIVVAYSLRINFKKNFKKWNHLHKDMHVYMAFDIYHQIAFLVSQMFDDNEALRDHRQFHGETHLNNTIKWKI